MRLDRRRGRMILGTAAEDTLTRRPKVGFSVPCRDEKQKSKKRKEVVSFVISLRFGYAFYLVTKQEDVSRITLVVVLMVDLVPPERDPYLFVQHIGCRLPPISSTSRTHGRGLAWEDGDSVIDRQSLVRWMQADVDPWILTRGSFALVTSDRLEVATHPPVPPYRTWIYGA
nr:hypothetical protein CFP56_68760 [Quercus suber]